MAINTKSTLFSRLNWKTVLLAIGLIILVIAILEVANVTHIFHKKKQDAQPVATGSNQNDKGTTNSPDNSSSNSSATSQSSEPGDNKATANTTATLLEPTGNFVSNHHAKINDSQSSGCTTTAGATCQIIFTKGSTVKSLDVQTTDRGGTTYWNSWSPASIGLSPGTWKVQAKASLNGQTKTADDAIDLEISQ